MVRALVLSMMLALGACATPSAPPAAREFAYLFSSFRGNGEDGLHLAYSYDGLTWTALNNDRSFLTPHVGGNLMRDPCIIRGPDGGYHMVWTTGWWDSGIAIAHSTDLVTWSEQTLLPVMAHVPNVQNAWAPEIFFDEETEEYLIFWSSTVPGAFPETEDRGDIRSTSGIGLNHRVYFTKTRDFVTYTPAALFYDGGFVSIDPTILRDGARVIMFIKDETKRPEPEKNIRIAIAASAQGPYGPASPPFTPAGVWVEGPTAVKIGDMFYVYYDAYVAPRRIMASRSRDLIHWEDISDQIRFPEGTRHGSVLEVDRTAIESLLARE
jgi:beta-xylosidase